MWGQGCNSQACNGGSKVQVMGQLLLPWAMIKCLKADYKDLQVDYKGLQDLKGL